MDLFVGQILTHPRQVVLHSMVFPDDHALHVHSIAPSILVRILWRIIRAEGSVSSSGFSDTTQGGSLRDSPETGRNDSEQDRADSDGTAY
jgi:hypothetical protein